MVAPLIIAGIAAAASALKAKDEQDQARQNILMQSEIMKNSPWTGIRPNMDLSQGPNVGTSAIGGGLQGYAFGQQFAGAAPAQSPQAPASAWGQMPLSNGMYPQQNPAAYSGMGAAPTTTSSWQIPMVLPRQGQ